MNQNTYKKISASEFEQYLNDTFGSFERVTRAGTKELVYDLPVAGSDDLTIRVFSSVAARDGAGRDAGADAIKCVVWSEARDRPVATAKRTNRIQTWRDNLTPKVDSLREEARALAAADAAETDAATAAVAALPIETGADDEVVVAELTTSRFGTKAALRSPYAAKDAIKALDWETTHRAWNPDAKAWEVDAEALADVATHLADAGWTLAAADESEPAFTVAAAIEDAGLTAGDRVTVEYVQKNNGGTNTKTGTVTSVRDGDLSFRRDDGQAMHTRDGGLYTVGSYAPYVGMVSGIESGER